MLHDIASPGLPKGLAFDISDHVRVGQWATARDYQVNVDLSYGVEGEEYEEVLMFYSLAPVRRLCCVMWRQIDCVVVQPIPGRQVHFSSVRDALRGLTPPRR